MRHLTLLVILVVCITTGALHAGNPVEPLTTELVAGGLDHVTQVTHAPGDYTRLYIVEKQGRIKVLNLVTGVVNVANFLDIDALVGGGELTFNEMGLLGLAFHPDWQTNRYFYVYYTNVFGHTTVARYTAFSPDTAITGSASTVLNITQPYANHNGGWMAFGPQDGYLYISTGDGGSFGDPGNRAQTITDQLLGKILRIDVNAGAPYGIPPTNPLVGVEGDDEIWAYGLRNPWRCSFDRASGDLWIGDVGQNEWEEIDYQPAADATAHNYGWRCREGANDFDFTGDCDQRTLTEPVLDYDGTLGSSVTGGYVYRGCAIPSLRGTYFFGDYMSGRIFTFTGPELADFQDRTTELTPPGAVLDQISSFGEDARGELYIVDQGSGATGQIFRIVPVTPTVVVEDLDCDGEVELGDVLRVIDAWGACNGCPEDLSGNGSVDFADVLLVIAAWG